MGTMLPPKVWKKDWQKVEEDLERERYRRRQIDDLRRSFELNGVRGTTFRDPVRDQLLYHIEILTADSGWLVLYHGPFPPTRSDILDHWSKLIGNAIIGDAEK